MLVNINFDCSIRDKYLLLHRASFSRSTSRMCLKITNLDQINRPTIYFIASLDSIKRQENESSTLFLSSFRNLPRDRKKKHSKTKTRRQREDMKIMNNQYTMSISSKLQCRFNFHAYSIFPFESTSNKIRFHCTSGEHEKNESSASLLFFPEPRGRTKNQHSKQKQGDKRRHENNE